MLYGNVINRLLESQTLIIPRVGMGATELHWSDRTAGTLVEVHTPKSGEARGQITRIAFQADHAERIDAGGAHDVPRYRYTPDPEGPITWYTLRRNGKWVREGSALKDGTCLALNRRDAHFDPSF